MNRETIDSNDPIFFDDGESAEDYGWLDWLKAWFIGWWELLTQR